MGQDDLPHYLSNLVQENPLTRLKALREVRRQSEGMLDALEADLVQQALKATSLPEVAKALGISTSKAHRKYRHLLPEEKRRHPQRRPARLQPMVPPTREVDRLSKDKLRLRALKSAQEERARRERRPEYEDASLNSDEVTEDEDQEEEG